MSVPVTVRTQRILDGVQKRPNIVAQLDGVDEIFGAGTILRSIRIGDPDLEIGSDWAIGGKTEVDEQASLIILGGRNGGTDTRITQQISQDSSESSSLQTIRVAFADKDGRLSRLVSPGVEIDDIMARKMSIWFGFQNSSFPEDYAFIFRGIVSDVQIIPGKVTMTISHPDRKKNQNVYNTYEGKLDEPLDDSETTITLLDAGDLLQKITGPDGNVDATFKHYIRVDDEIIEYAAVSGNDLTGCTRGALGTLAVTHEDEADVKSVYRLEGNAMDLALKFMLSGWNDYFIEEVSPTNFVRGQDSEDVANSIYFRDTDVEQLYGLTPGDFVTSAGASNGANNFTLKEILEVVLVDGGGSYIVVDGVTFVQELDTAAELSFRSKYDTLPDGLKMSPDEVDVAEHEYVQNIFLQSFDYDFQLQEPIENGREFLVKQIYRPASTLEMVRKSRASCKFQIGPLPGADIVVLDETVLQNPSQITKRRSLGKNFYNTIIYKYDPHPVETDRWRQGAIYTDATSRNRIKVGTKAFVVESMGLRDPSIIQVVAERRLRKYKYAAEYYDGVKTGLKGGLLIEPGDIVIFDGSRLKVTDLSTGARNQPPKFLEVTNKSLDLRTGEVILQLDDTNYDIDARYALISPASYISSATSGTEFQIRASFSAPFGTNEWKKWKRYEGCTVRVRNADFSNSAEATLLEVNFNFITLGSALGFTPAADDIMELCDYNQATEILKLKYGWMTDEVAFDDGTSQYKMI